MHDANSQRDKTASTESCNSNSDQEKIDNYNSSTTNDHNQDPRNMNTRSLDYESVILNSLPRNLFLKLFVILLTLLLVCQLTYIF